MTTLDDRVYLRFRGRTRSLPLAAIALALRKDLDGAARSLEILILGPPESRSTTEHRPRSVRAHPGEGVGGGVYPERSERLVETSGTLGPNDSETFPENILRERSDRERSERSDAPARVDEPDDAAFARRIAIDLADEDNVRAIRTLVTRYPRSVLKRALVRTLAVPADRIRSSRGAIFTGIVRRLAGETSHSSTPST